MGYHAAIRGILSVDLVPEFLWKYLDSPLEDRSGITNNTQKEENTDKQL
jgi:hypothetical protein